MTQSGMRGLSLLRAGASLLALGAGLGGGIAPAAYAQDAAPAEEQQVVTNAKGEVVLQTVTLKAQSGVTEGTESYTTGRAATATGLPISIRETPQSVSVVTEQRIQDQGLNSTREILNYTTGVNAVSYETDRDSTYARGYWVGNYIIDGVALPTYQGWYSGVSVNSSSATYDRVEVLRGATGLLTGSGEPGAAVSITRKRANATQQEGSMALRYGSWNRVGGTIDMGTPLNADASVRARFILDADSGDSFVDRYHLDRQTYYAAIDADLTPATKLSFSLEHVRYDPTGTTWGELPALFTDGGQTDFPRGFSNAPDWAYWSSKQTSAVARIEHRFDNDWAAEASFGTTYRQYNAALLYMWGDLDRETGLGLNPSAWGGEERTRLLSFDAKATGPVEFLGRSHTLNFGIRADRDWIKRSWPGYSGDIAEIGDIFEWDGSYPRPDWNPIDLPGWDSNVTKYSAYASGRFSITEPLTVILGGRYTDWRSEFEDDSRQFGEFVPFAGVVYDINDQWSAYASYTEVFDPQSYRDRSGAYLDPVVGKSYELGAKAELFNGGMNATVALFDTVQDNVAVQDGDEPLPGGEYAYRAEKGIRSRGVEVELSGELRPGWNLFLGATALRMKAADGSDHAPDQPRRSVKLFTTYEPGGRLDNWTLGGGLRWQNRTWADVTIGDSDYRVPQGSYAVVDVMARYALNDKWSAQLNFENLLDKKHYNNPGSQVSYGPPRNAALTLVAKF